MLAFAFIFKIIGGYFCLFLNLISSHCFSMAKKAISCRRGVSEALKQGNYMIRLSFLKNNSDNKGENEFSRSYVGESNWKSFETK